MGESAYELVGRLPGRVRFVSRYQARYRPLERIVEFRFERKSRDPRMAVRFQQELEELSRLDHPSFLPVVDRGALRGRHGYVVPFREHPTIPELVAAKQLDLATVLGCVRSLASGVAAAHAAGFFLGPILPKCVAWDEAAGQAYLLHHRVGTPKYLKRPQLLLPEDVRPGQPHSERADLFHWGFFAYYLLSRGTTPRATGEVELAPLRQLCPQLSEATCSAVEAALALDPAERPRDGAAIRSVLRIAGLQLAPPPASEPAPEEPAEEMLASARFSAAVQDLDGLREKREAWRASLEDTEVTDDSSAADSEESAGGPEEPEPPEAPETEEAEPAEEAPNLSMFQSGAGPNMAALGALAQGAAASLPEPLPALQDAAPWLAGAGLAAVLLAVGATLASEPALDPAPTKPVPQPLFGRRKDDGSVAADGSVQALDEARALPYRRNPLVREMLGLEKVTPKLYPKVMQRLILLAEDGRLPGAFQNPERLDDIGELYLEYPEQACGELTKVLDDLRVVLGPLQ